MLGDILCLCCVLYLFARFQIAISRTMWIITLLKVNTNSDDPSILNMCFCFKAKSTTPEDSRTTNPDGLVYTTIAFSDNQLKKAQQPPPERETTEYAGIDFTRHAPPAQD